MSILFVIMLIIEFLLDNSSVERLTPDLNLHAVVQLERSVYQSHGTTLIHRNETIARSDHTDRLAILEHCVAMTGHSFVVKLYAAQPLCHAISLLLDKCLFADEFWLIQFAKHAQARHNW